MTTTTIDIDPIGPVEFVSSTRAIRLSITVKSDGSVRVAVPRGMPISRARKFLSSRVEWVIRSREKLRGREVPRGNMPPVDRNRAKVVLALRLKELAMRYGFNYNKLYVRNQKTRWGSCSSKNNISLNMRLVLLPDDLRDFILLHELIHTKVKNHGNDFWREIMKVEPKARELTKQINQYNLMLL